jgi:hypothetical protein
MAEITLALASSHGTALQIPPQRWRLHADLSAQRPELIWFRGQQYPLDELAQLRASDHFARECNDARYEEQSRACQQAIGHLRETLERANPDVCLIIGDDQDECFHSSNLPVFAIFNGSSVTDARISIPNRDQNPLAGAALADPQMGNIPEEALTHPVDAELANHLISSLVRDDFDIARVNHIPSDGEQRGIGHAFSYAYRRLMSNRVLPHVPLFVNTYYPPNVPSARCCFQLGRAIAQAIAAWDGAQRVAVIASGGLSHAAVDEDLDRRFIAGLANHDIELLTEYPDVYFRSGTSEIKNWIILAGTVFETDLEMRLVEYVPTYRSAAGTGLGMGFAEWL